MARIRTIKPEIWESEDIATVSVTALVTFVGLLTQADDEGRFRDHPAIIAGRIWALRQEHTPAHVAQDLEELATAGLICRYTGCDGRTYLHIVTWERHQKINRASESRLPRCSGHQGHRNCGRCEKGACPSSAGAPASPTVAKVPAIPPSAPGDGRPAASEDAASSPSGSPDPAPEPIGDQSPQASKKAGQDASVAGFSEDSRPGSRILDPGSSRRGRAAPAPDAAPGTVSAQELVAEYVKGCHQRPPGDTVGLLGRKIRALLDEGFDPEHIRAAMDRLRAKALHPSVLPSLVNEVVNPPLVGVGAPYASGGAPWASTAACYRPYFNAAQPEPTTFGGSL
ncbi:hypothetical protein [Streptomyces amakusaensis]|uniref:Uncharacterized protein n=1 Tax=Streptomyces amakusaensis TaxID=67271 RepID=A0ABW0AJY9_9ACTN